MTQSFHCTSHSPCATLRVCVCVQVFCVLYMSAAVHITAVLAQGLYQPEWIAARWFFLSSSRHNVVRALFMLRVIKR